MVMREYSMKQDSTSVHQSKVYHRAFLYGKNHVMKHRTVQCGPQHGNVEQWIKVTCTASDG